MPEIVDRKFQIDAVNPVNGKKYTEKNAILLCAKDLAVVPALRAYLEECKKLKCHREHIQSISLLILRVLKFQETQVHIPDTHLPGEIERCIRGKNLERKEETSK